MDVNFQHSCEQNINKDIQVMKVVHDLKNPVLSIKQNLNDEDTTIEIIQESCCADIEEIEEMSDNLRLQFKSQEKMTFNEKQTSVIMLQFAQSLIPTHTQMAISGKNDLVIKLLQHLPITVNIQRSLVKRIVNNFISNSLKHTLNGKITIEFSLLK